MTPLLSNIIKLAENQEASDYSYLWAGYSCIAAQLGRNISIPFGNGRIYPNLYMMFVGDPGKRKSTAIKDMKRTLKATGYSSMCGNKVTMEKYLADLAGVGEDSENDISFGISLGLNDFVESYIAQDEFSAFIGINNYPFITLLGDFWDIDDNYTYRTKSGKSIEVPNPIVNILGATTPSQFNTIFPPAIGEQGFLSRLIIVNIPEAKRKISRPLPSDRNIVDSVTDSLRELRSLKGEAIISEEVWQKLDDIYTDFIPIEDSRFSHYSTRRHTQLLKLCLITMASRNTLEMTVEDVIFSNTLLAFTEYYMPQALGQYGKNKDGDVSSKIVSFLLQKFPTPMSTAELLIPVGTDIKARELVDVLNNLVITGKIVLTGGGYLPKILSYKDSKAKHVDWSLLGDIVESKFS